MAHTQLAGDHAPRPRMHAPASSCPSSAAPALSPCPFFFTLLFFFYVSSPPPRLAIGRKLDTWWRVRRRRCAGTTLARSLGLSFSLAVPNGLPLTWLINTYLLCVLELRSLFFKQLSFWAREDKLRFWVRTRRLALTVCPAWAEHHCYYCGLGEPIVCVCVFSSQLSPVYWGLIGRQGNSWMICCQSAVINSGNDKTGMPRCGVGWSVRRSR